MTDIKYAFRTLLKNPGFAAVAIVTLALGIGANTAIFSVVNGVLLRPLPFRDADRIIRVYTETADERRSGHAAGDFLDLQRENQSLSAIAGFRMVGFTVVPRSGEPVLLVGAHITLDFFEVLGVAAAVGRTPSRSLDAGRGERLVVLSREAWRQLYADAADVAGQQLKVNGEPHTVAGVLPVRAEWPEGSRLWVLSPKEVPPSPVAAGAREGDREVQYFDAVARLRPGITFEQARQDMKRMDALIQPRRRATDQQRTIEILPIREVIVGDVRFGLLVMQAAVGLVVLIACANVSSLLLARASGRRRELAVRAALGASRARLGRQLLAESLVLGALGGAVGLLLGAWLIGFLTTWLPDGIPRTDEIGLDTTVAAMTLLTALSTSLLFGVMPAAQASRADASSALKLSGERGSTGRARARAMLVVAEVALTLVLLTGAGLLLNSFLRLQRVDSGMQPENVTVVSLGLPDSRYPTSAKRSELYGRLIEALSRRGDLQAAGIGFPAPLRGDNASGAFFVEGRPADSSANPPFANFGLVSGGYFAAMGIPLLAGRTFSESDGADAPDVAIVNMALARKYWPGEDVIGKRIRFDDKPGAASQTVVGLVGDARQLGLDQDAPPILYMPYAQFSLPFTNVAVRSASSPAAVASFVRAELAAIDPDLPLGEFRTLQSVFDRSVAEPRFRTLLISAFAAVALVLAAVGVFGLISFSVVQRTREIGIRIALGASAPQVLHPMVREGLSLAGAGVAIGLLGAFVFARVIASFLYEVPPTDPITFGGVAIVLLVVAFLATYIPARRALRVDPVSALRAE